MEQMTAAMGKIKASAEDSYAPLARRPSARITVPSASSQISASSLKFLL